MKKFLCIFIAVFLLTQCLCACGGDGELTPEEFNALTPAEGPEELVVILGYHANAVKPSEEDIRSKLKPLLDKSIAYYYDEQNSDYCATINMTVIIADGNPEIVKLVDYYEDKQWDIELNLSDESSSLLLMDVEDALNNIYTAVSSDNLRANDQEVDLHAALRMAGNILRENSGGKGNILVFDSGIVTSGYLNMNALPIRQEGADAKEILANLSPSSVIDLQDINVEFYGLANTCGAQTSVKSDAVVADRIVAFWTGYLQDVCNANLPYKLTVSEWVGTKLHSNEDGEDTYPPVSDVPFKLAAMPIDTTGEGTGEEGGTTTGGNGTGVIVLNTASLKFKGDSSEFKDPEIAEATLLSYEATFETLKVNKIPIYVVGSIARTSPDHHVTDAKCSAERAEAVKNLICKVYGIPAEQIITIDAGTQKFTWRDAEEFPDGQNKDRNAQQENRVVAIIPATAQQVQELVDAGEIPAA